MKPYGLRPGDGIRMPKGRGPDRRLTGLNKFLRLRDEGGPRGKNRQAKIGKEKRAVHRQGRADEKALLREELENWQQGE